jgi:hypothetical protein
MGTPARNRKLITRIITPSNDVGFRAASVGEFYKSELNVRVLPI